jgi:protein-L-isoaspartate(D-aspartate) O-methyltransferase
MDEKLLQFFHSLDRSLFIDNRYKTLAKLDRPLPIGHGQTISQPSLVVYMSAHLRLDKTTRVLEVGTGSGYQTAFLAEFAKEVYTVELRGELGVKARQRLDALGYRNIQYTLGDGSLGWAEHAPYERILVTAAPKRMPEDLIDQLAPEGIMILPLGSPGYQQLIMITKDVDGGVTQTKLLDVAFVPLVGKYS